MMVKLSQLQKLYPANVLSEIERQMASVQKALLPALATHLIESHQKVFEGKKIRRKNGSDMVEVHSLFGSYIVRNQRYLRIDGSSTSYLEESASLCNGFYSPALGAFIEEWVQSLSYEKLRVLLAQITQNEVLTGSGIQSYLARKAEAVSMNWAKESLSAVATSPLQLASEIDLYAENTKEIVAMLDDICVKAQKPHKKTPRIETDAKRLDTSVFLLLDSKNNYHHATAGINRQGEVIYPLDTAIEDKVRQLHNVEEPLALVALTDGARSLRITLQAVFGMSVCIILDWYHLQLKVKNLFSMIGQNKKQKEQCVKDLKTLLWVGKAKEAIEYLNQMDKAHIRNQEKWEELRTYFEKHAHEIIDYERRQKAKKTIGSGRVEKANDLIVANRQKRKGIAWARTGSSALAVIPVQRLNYQIVN